MPAAFKAQLGTGLATTSGTTVTITTTAAIAVGDLVVVRVASDNLSATTPTFTCADGSANVYTNQRQGAVNASAAAGIAGAIFTCKATVVRAIGSVITVTLSGAVAHKAAMATSYTQTDNTVRSAAVSATGIIVAASAGASGTVNSGDLVLGTIANETRGTITGDSDTINGAWSALVISRSATSGTDASCVSVAGQHKIPTAAGAQTYNVTAIASEWWISALVMQASVGFGSAVGVHDWTSAGGAVGNRAPKGAATTTWANAVTAVGDAPAEAGSGPAWSYDFTDDADGPMPATFTTFGGSLPGKIVSGHLMCQEDWFFTRVYDTLVTQDDPQHLIAAEVSFRTASGQMWLIFAANADATTYSALQFNADGTWLFLGEGGGSGGSPNFAAFTPGATYKIHITFNETNGAYEIFFDGVSVKAGTHTHVRTGNRFGFFINGNLDMWLYKLYYGPQSAGVPGAGGGGGGGTGAATTTWVNTVTAVGGSSTGAAKTRAFDGSSYIEMTAGALVGMTYGSLAAVFKLNGTIPANDGWTPVSVRSTVPNNAFEPSLDTYDGALAINMYIDASGNAGVAMSYPTGWALGVFTKATGSQPRKLWLYSFDSGTWIVDGVSTAGSLADSVRTVGAGIIGAGRAGGGYEQLFRGSIAGAAVWKNRVLTDVEVKTLKNDWLAWQTSGPTSLWVLNQTSTATLVPDRVGTSPQSAISGTTISAEPSPLGEGSLVYSDDFNRANGSLGASWYGPSFTIDVNRANKSGGSGDYAVFNQNLGSADTWVEADVGPTSEGSFKCVNLRRPNATDHAVNGTAYLGFVDPGNLAPIIGRSSAGSYSQVANAAALGAYPTKIRLEAQGSTLRLYCDGVLRITTTDTTHPTGSYTGLNANAGHIDNFRTGALPYVPVGGGGTGTGSATTSWSANPSAVGVAPGALNITETWTGTTGTPWPTPKWTVSTPLPGDWTVTNTIQSNRGRLTAAGGTYALALARLAASTHTDIDVRFTYTSGSGSAEQYINAFYRLDHLGSGGLAGFPTECYVLDFEPQGNVVMLQKIDATATPATLATVNSAGVNVTSDLNVRILVVGNNHKAKWWTGTEPGTWQIDVNDSTYASGGFAFGLYSGNSATQRQVEFDDLTVAAPAAPPATVVTWKGVGSVSRANLPAELALVKASWFYDWANYSDTDGLPPVPSTPGVDYIPMMWGDWERTYPGFDIGGPPSESCGPATVLLGFNEPNIAEQADMTVARCRALWPQLEATGRRLGSPAMSPNGAAEAYLDTFLANTSGYQPRVDFICAHWYPQFNGGYANIADYLDYLHTRYGKPIWLTEVCDLVGGAGGQAANAALMSTVFAALATRPWIERVAWFALQPTEWVGTELVTSAPALTTSGTQYATYDNVIGTQAGGAGLTWGNAATAVGKRTAKAAAITTYTFNPVAAGKKTSQGTANTGNYTETVTASGKRTPKGAAITGNYTEVVTAAGKKTQNGSATGNYTEVVTAAGKRTAKSTVTTAHTWAPTAAGKRAPKATATTTHLWTPDAFATDASVGLGTIANTWNPSAVGKRAPKGTPTVNYIEALNAVGIKPTKGTALTAAWVETLTSAGKRAPISAVAMTWTNVLASTGKRTPKSAAVVAAHSWIPVAFGFAPTLGVKQGSGFAAWTAAVTATGKRVARGASTTTYAEVLTATGKKIQQSALTINVTETTAAAGKRAPIAAAEVSYTETLTAPGKRTPKAAGVAAHSWAPVAQGVRPIPGVKQGSGIINNTWASAGTGKRAPKGSSTRSVFWDVFAVGGVPQRGAATTSHSWTAAATGAKAPKGSATTLSYSETLTVVGKRNPRAGAVVDFRFVTTARGTGAVFSTVSGQFNGMEFDGMQYGGYEVADWLLVPV